MKIDWKGLREQKLAELPAAEIARQKRLEKIVNRIEKNIYNKCRHQEAGTTECYSTVHQTSFTENLVCFFTESGPWSWDEEVKETIQNAIVERLSEQGIKVEKVKGWFQVSITLP